MPSAIFPTIGNFSARPMAVCIAAAAVETSDATVSLVGFICFYATQMVKSTFEIDDSLDVFPVHGVGGILGIIMLAIVGDPNGFLGSGASGISDDGVMAQLLIQLQGVLVIGIWTLVVTYIILRVLNMFTEIRVSEEGEEEGLDVYEHNEQGYSL